jgi:hypothetical protein
MMAGSTNDNIPIMARTLHKRLDEKGILLTKERNRLTVRITLEATRKRVLHVHTDSLLSQKVDQVDQPGHDPDYSAKNEDSGPLSRSTSGPDGYKSGPDNGPENPANEIKNDGGGPVGPVGPLLNTKESQNIVTPDDLPPNRREEYEERAGIKEDSDMPREQAEVEAMSEILAKINNE